MKPITKFFALLFSALVLIAVSAGAGNGGVNYDAIEKGPTAAESAPTGSESMAEAAQKAQRVMLDSIEGLVKTSAMYAVGTSKLLPISTKPVDSGYQMTPERGSWGYALVKGPAAIHSLGDERLWHKIDVTADEWVILLSWGRQFTVETSDSDTVVAATSNMSEKVNETLLNKWVEIVEKASFPWKYYELRENGNFLETRLGGW